MLNTEPQKGRFLREIKGLFQVLDIDPKNSFIDLIPIPDGPLSGLPCITMKYIGQLFDINLGDIIGINASAVFRQFSNLPKNIKVRLLEEYNNFAEVFSDIPSLVDDDGNYIEHYLIDKIKLISCGQNCLF